MIELPIIQPEAYREHLATVDHAGKRVWVFPKAPKGPMFRHRIWVTVICLAVLFSMPLIRIDGHPFFLFNVFEGKFILFGNAFFPQDFYLFAVGLIIFFVFIILFTVVYGRIWCGWACPQTLFMEMIFRQIEYQIDGDAPAQRRLAAQPLNAEKIAKRSAKYLTFSLISALIAHTAMAYLIGLDKVVELVTHTPANNPAGFTGLLVFTGFFFFAFTYLREQVCTVICPYGRLQGVLIDKRTAQVTYDTVRGEPRGKKGLVEGDCVDCTLCVQVCPTGIDIRNGSQMECVNCTACIDACDAVMLKIHRPEGLIRIDSLEGITEGKRFTFSRRVAGYSLILFLLLGLEAVLFARRAEVDTTVMRVPGTLFQKQPDGRISNLYNIQLVNKTFDLKTLRLSTPLKGAEIRIVGESLTLSPAAKAEAVVFIILPKDQLHSAKTRIPIEVYCGAEKVAETGTTFFSPVN